MSKLINIITKPFKYLFRKTVYILTRDILLIASWIFIYIIPILRFGRVFAYTKEYSAGTKWTTAGIIALVIIFLIIKKKIKERILGKPESVARAIKLGFHTAFNWAAVFGILYVIKTFSALIFDTWIDCGISILIGIIFNIFYEKKINKIRKGG